MVVAITGGIATGKSTVTRMLRDFGATTFSADEAARVVLQPGSEAMAEIAVQFGSSMIQPDGTLNRSALAAVVFDDPDALQRLNRLMHPRIRRLLREQIRSAQDDLPLRSIIAVEVPLLFESNQQGKYERIVVVAASESVQIARLREKSGMSEADARKRLAAQMPLQEKIAAASYVVVNDGALQDLAPQVETLYRKLESERAQA